MKTVAQEFIYWVYTAEYIEYMEVVLGYNYNGKAIRVCGFEFYYN